MTTGDERLQPFRRARHRSIAAGLAALVLAACAAPEGFTTSPYARGDAGDGATGAQGSILLDAAAGDGAPSTGGGAEMEGDRDGGAGDSDAGGGALPDCPSSQYLPPGSHEFTLVSKNLSIYKYIVVVPPGIEPGQRTPVIFVWHALWSSPAETRRVTHIDETLKQRKAIGVFPWSLTTSWNAGSCCSQYTALLGLRDETVFARELVDEVEAKVCVDTRRVYTTGFSNGGMLTQVLACNMADVFAAAAPMASALTILPSTCRPSRAIPILMINGTLDLLVGYYLPTFDLGLSVPLTFSNWAALDGCTGQPQTFKQGLITRQTYDTCRDGVEVTLWTVEGMGHCLPGMKEEIPGLNCLTKGILPLGPPNHDIDGIDIAADFLFSYSLP